MGDAEVTALNQCPIPFPWRASAGRSACETATDSGLAPEVQVAEKGDLGTVVGLLVKQDSDNLACRLRLAQVARPEVGEVSLGGRLQPGRHRLTARAPQIHRPLHRVRYLQIGEVRWPGPKAYSQ